jgi:hypothetical protein
MPDSIAAVKIEVLPTQRRRAVQKVDSVARARTKSLSRDGVRV